MKKQMKSLAGALLLVVAACGGAGEEEPENAAPVTAADSVVSDAVFRDTARETLPTHRIYYTLTSHEWYARGQPLMHDGAPHQPAGAPVSASAERMTRAGEYEGVEYYTSGDEAGVVYVPVFEGYWQAFRSTAQPAEQPS